MDAASDAELVARCRAGDETEWHAVVDRYARYVHAIVTRVYRLPPDDAEDVFQEVFARVFERLDTLRDGDALRPWIAVRTIPDRAESRIAIEADWWPPVSS